MPQPSSERMRLTRDRRRRCVRPVLIEVSQEAADVARYIEQFEPLRHLALRGFRSPRAMSKVGPLIRLI
jgi:hypothetical protein